MANGRVVRAGRPTMRDVARAAGVSAMTVSRVLNRDPRVAPETRARVESTVATLRYRRDELARSLRPGRATGILGLIVPNLAIPFYARLALSLEEVIDPRDLTLVVGNTGYDVTHERQLVERLLSRRVDGILIEPTGREQAHLLAAMQHTPLVFVNHPPCGLSADCVLNDDVGGARAATTDLIQRGHTQIAFAGFAARSYSNARRLRGFRAALQAHGLSVPPRFILRDVHDAATTEAAMRVLLGQPDPPTALFTAHNRMTVGAVRAMHAVGRGLELAQFGDFDLSDLLGCALTIAVNDREQMANVAVHLLLDRIDGAQAPARRIYVPTRLERREPLWRASLGFASGASTSDRAVSVAHAVDSVGHVDQSSAM